MAALGGKEGGARGNTLVFVAREPCNSDGWIDWRAFSVAKQMVTLQGMYTEGINTQSSNTNNTVNC